MSNPIVFKVARAGKIDGKEWKAGQLFPYDPSSRQHFLFYEQGRLIAEYAPKPAAKKRTAKKAD